MDEDRIIKVIENLLTEYESITTSTDLLKYAKEIDDLNSTLNVIGDLIDTSILSRVEAQIFCNQLTERIQNKVGEAFFSFPFYKYEKVNSVDFNRIRVYSLLFDLLDLEKFESFTLKECFEVVKSDEFLTQTLRAHLRWKYREKILTKFIYKLDPKTNASYGPPKFSGPDPESNYSHYLEPIIKRSKLDYPFYELSGTFISFYMMYIKRLGGQLSKSAMIQFFDEYITDKSTVELEFLLKDLLTNLISNYGELVLIKGGILSINVTEELTTESFGNPLLMESNEHDQNPSADYVEVNTILSFCNLLMEKLKTLYLKERESILNNILKNGEKATSVLSNRSVENRKNQKLKTLLDIWEFDKNGTKQEYDRTIERLKLTRESGSSFLTEKDGQLYWTNVFGKFSYLAGFIYECIQKRWIKRGYSAPTYLKILNKTFNAEIRSTTHFKSIDVTPPPEKYHQLFKNLPPNS